MYMASTNRVKKDGEEKRAEHFPRYFPTTIDAMPAESPPLRGGVLQGTPYVGQSVNILPRWFKGKLLK